MGLLGGSGRRERELEMKRTGRLPPGQVLTEKWPVLHHGPVPFFDSASWEFRVAGLVEKPLRLSWAEFGALPRVRLRNDIHCVTRWSKFDCEWEGVAVSDLMRRAAVDPRATHVLVHGELGYSANLPLEEFLHESVLFANRMNGADLTPEHGWPLRLVVPRLYFWKSVKWVRGVDFLDHDVAGFWEQNGYHNDGDPFREQRFWGD
jgi:DMSO/TMAO reductase YedYZ molybdopterin-dependent catalytic subunit